MKYNFIILLLFFFFFPSCVMDSFEYFCLIKNTSKRNITIRFSNSEILDTSILFHENWGLSINSNYTQRVNKDLDILHKEIYRGNYKKLYLFFLDQDTLLQLYKKGEMNNIIKQSFLQRQLVDVNNIKETDTLFYTELIK